MPRTRPACEIEPVRSIASSRRIFPGPMDRPGPKSTRRVSLVPLTTPAPVWRGDDTSDRGRRNILHLVSVMVKSRGKCSFLHLCAGMPDLLTTDEAATYLRLSERKLYELVATAAVPCSKVTGRWLFPKRALDRWVTAGLLTTAPLAQPAPPIVGGSHDPLLEWALRESGSGLATLPEGSESGLRRLARGDVLAAAIHLHRIEGDDDSANADAVANAPGLHDAVVIAFARREQGLLVAPGNPLQLSDIASTVAARARMALRPNGAGAQLLLLALLARSGIAFEALNTLKPPCPT